MSTRTISYINAENVTIYTTTVTDDLIEITTVATGATKSMSWADVQTMPAQDHTTLMTMIGGTDLQTFEYCYARLGDYFS
jgi:hypothetical protein